MTITMPTRHFDLACLFALVGAACAADPLPAAAPPANAPATPPACPTTVPTAQLPAAGADAGDAPDPEASARFEGLAITRVCLLGGGEASRAQAGRLPLLHEGEVLTAERVRKDLGSLLSQGAFDDASAFGIPRQVGAGGVVLVYALHERPIAADIAIEGAKVLATEHALPDVQVGQGAPYDARKATDIAHSIHDLYVARGYGAARAVVVTEPVPSPANAVKVRIKVDEGVQWHLSKLEIRGNQKVSEAEIRKAFNLKVGDPFRASDVERGDLAASSLLFDRGLIGMHLDFQRPRPDASGNIPLTVVVEEGEVHTLRAIHVTGLGAPLEKELLERVIHARPKQVFSRGALFEDMARVKEFFKQRGQEVQVLPQTEIDPKDHTVVLTVDVQS